MADEYTLEGYIRCPNGCGAMAPKDGLEERVRRIAKDVGYPIPDREYSDDELMRISCDITQRIECGPDGKIRLKAA